MKRARQIALLASVVFSACGADPRTGIVVEVTTDLRVPTDLNEVRVSATSASGTSLFEKTFALGSPGTYSLPLRVGFEPSRDTAAAFRIEAVGLHGGKRVVSRSASLSFARGKVVLLQLALLASCADVTCDDAATTCDVGACVPDTVDAKSLPSYRPLPDGGGPIGRDGPTADAGADAPPGDGPTNEKPSGDTPASDTPAPDAPAKDAASDAIDAVDARDAAATDSARDLPMVLPSLNNGLVAYWSFDTSSQTFPDHSGNHNDIPAAGQSLWTANGAYGGGLDLTAGKGTGAPASATVNTITKAITIGAFALIRPAGQVRTMVSRYLGSGYWKLGFADNGALRFTVGAQVIQAPAAPAANGKWVHVAGTYDGKTATLYVAGVEVVSGEVGVISLVGGPPNGGAGGYGPQLSGAFMDVTAETIEPYDGQLDELTLHNRALTPDEIFALAGGVFPTRAAP